MRKNLTIIITGIIFSLCLLMLCGMVRAEASTYYIRENTDGSGSLINLDTGKQAAHLKVKGGTICYSYLLTSDYVFYLSKADSNMNMVYKFYLYCYFRKTKTCKLLKYLGSGYSSITLHHAYNGSIYLSAFAYPDISKRASYRYSLSSGKLQKIMKKMIWGGYKQYLLVFDEPHVDAMLFCEPYYIYNIKTKETKKIADNIVSQCISGRYVYYVQPENPSTYNPFFTEAKHRIVRYDIITGKKTKLGSGILANQIGVVTSKYVNYYRYDSSGSQKLYYRYYFKNKTSKRVSEAVFASGK